jgi:hypothetical protein
MRTLALVLSLLAFGVLGLVACGGDDDETTAGSESKGAGSEERTAGSEKKAAKDEPASKKSCGEFDRWRLTVEGDVSCSTAHRVMRGEVHKGAPRPWTCSGPDAHIDCTKDEPGIVIKARF